MYTGLLCKMLLHSLRWKPEPCKPLEVTKCRTGWWAHIDTHGVTESTLLLWRCEAALGYRCIYSLCLIPCTPAYRWQNSINPYQNGRPRRRKKDMKTVKRCHIDLTLLKTKGWVNDKFNVQRSSLKKILSSNFWNNLPVSLSFWCNFISAHYLWTVKTNFWHTFLVAFSGLDGLKEHFFPSETQTLHF